MQGDPGFAGVSLDLLEWKVPEPAGRAPLAAKIQKRFVPVIHTVRVTPE